ncbi:MAG: hypothetical protein KU38_03775 [Sulfurovum sp. FS08-3]|nr:MAG: hypothetical protein KU38_03775 [Sulfurovum sp. FS08-3]
MQTLIVNVEESFIQDFLRIIEGYKDKIKLQKNPDWVQDPYFYQRQEQLQKTLEAIDSGKMKIYSDQESQKQIDALFERLEDEYSKNSTVSR